MSKSTDLAHRDDQYFIDEEAYNCPFCKRGNVHYKLFEYDSYDRSNNEEVFYYISQCLSCSKKAIHMSRYDLAIHNLSFVFPPKKRVPSYADRGGHVLSYQNIPIHDQDGQEILTLDQAFYRHEPAHYFNLDERIPKAIRLPLEEAGNCLSSDYLTGATACLRKAIYKLLQVNDIPAKKGERQFLKYDQRVDLLESKCEEEQILISNDAFTDLKDIHYVSSQELHDDDWEEFDSSKLHHLMIVMQEILYELYIVPDERTKRRQKTALIRKGAEDNKKK